MNMGPSSGLRYHKGVSRKTVKGRKQRAERAVIKDVRKECVKRDGYCRYGSKLFWDETRHCCDGPSEWAHFGAKKRFKTRGQDPEVRHTTAGSLMLCQKHHQDYDQGRLQIKAATKRGCDGRLIYKEKA